MIVYNRANMYKFYYYPVIKRNAASIGALLNTTIDEINMEKEYTSYAIYVTSQEKTPTEKNLAIIKQLPVNISIKKTNDRIEINIPNKKLLNIEVIYSLNNGRHDTLLFHRVNKLIHKLNLFSKKLQ
jgi:hypothetical protein